MITFEKILNKNDSLKDYLSEFFIKNINDLNQKN